MASGLRIDLNSIALPAGSLMKKVPCSPGLPSKRTCGCSTNGTLLALIRSITAFQVSHGSTAPKWCSGTSSSPTLLVAPDLGSRGGGAGGGGPGGAGAGQGAAARPTL